MTVDEELAKLEAAYSEWLDAGCPATIQSNGRTLTSTTMDAYSKRIDALRSASARAGSGAFVVAQFRRPE